MKKFITSAILAVSLFISGSASAHNFWVNAYDSFTHAPGHILAMIGFGHHLPVDDMLSGDFGNIAIEKYNLTGPDGKVQSLGLPVTKRQKLEKTPWGATFEKGDIGLRKVAMSKKSPKGTYMISAGSQPTFFTKYINKKGKMRLAMTSMDKVKDAKEVLESFKYAGYAKSYVAFGKWTAPQKAGGDLEIIPLTDLSNLKAGDMVEFEVTLRGKKVITDANHIERLVASSETFGNPDGFQLQSFIHNGKAKFRIPTPGQWLVNVLIEREVDSTPELSYLKGQTKKVFLSDAISFMVKP